MPHYSSFIDSSQYAKVIALFSDKPYATQVVVDDHRHKRINVKKGKAKVVVDFVRPEHWVASTDARQDLYCCAIIGGSFWGFWRNNGLIKELGALCDAAKSEASTGG